MRYWLVKILFWVKSRPVFASLIALVCIWHLAVLLVVTKNARSEEIVVAKKPLLVRTVRLNPKQRKVRKKRQKVEKKPKAKRDDVLRKKELDDILKKVKENIAKIEQTPHKIEENKIEIPEAIEEDENRLSLGEEYIYMLAYHLERLLKFPEYGDVRINLTLRRDGFVEDVLVTISQSKKNSAYVMSVLPEAKLPPFGQKFSVGKKTFNILLNTSQLPPAEAGGLEEDSKP